MSTGVASEEAGGEAQAAAGGATTSATSSPLSFRFEKAFELELKAVQERRKLISSAIGGQRYFSESYRARVGADLVRGPSTRLTTQFNFTQTSEQEKEFLFARPYKAGEPITEADSLNLTGLCMSGGGIRSAAVNLGVTQALDALSPSGRSDVLDSLDYLSTVSGGNYIGTSIAAGMMQPPDPNSQLPGNRFPYESKTDGSETPETSHLRDYSSYLTPNGFRDIIANLLIVVRGLLGNIVMLLGALLLLAWFQLLLTPTTYYLSAPRSLWLAERLETWLGLSWPEWAGGFVVSLMIGALILALMLVWTCLKRWIAYRSGLSAREKISALMIGLTGLALLVAFFEWQPAILASMRTATAPMIKSGASASDWITQFFGWLGSAGYVFGPAAAAMLALGSKLINVVKAATGDASFSGRVRRYAGKGLLVFLGISVPILLWISFLNLVHAGICMPGGQGGCTFEAPGWFASAGNALALWGKPPSNPVIWLYFWGFVACIVVTSFFSPNANSLHQLYRDRLSRAFLIERGYLEADAATPRPTIEEQTQERLPQPDDYTFSSLKPQDYANMQRPGWAWAPYLLVNTAINLQADYLGQRGRQADTFTLGPLASGSDATGYVRTVDLEDRHPRLTLASGLAISGAAASANMGGNTIPIITFSLAALNVRLGYWLPNPAKLALFPPSVQPAGSLRATSPWKRWESGLGNWYFMRELFGRIGQTSRRIYLTDGGHIENLGLYELTKRRCRVIICVDAEADQGMVFPSLVKAQLMMRVDHGVRMELPWPEISEATRAAGEKIGTPQESRLFGKAGPHVAVGRIIYREPTREAPEGVHGVIIYIKSSMTGDESDLLRDYKRRYGDFPHETTLDQFFSEEQFEVYRALGFHMAMGFLTGKHDGAFWTPEDAKKRAEFFADVASALESIAVPREHIDRIMERAHKRAETMDRARQPKPPRSVSVTITPPPAPPSTQAATIKPAKPPTKKAVKRRKG